MTLVIRLVILDHFGSFLEDHPYKPTGNATNLLTVKTKKRHMTLSSGVPVAGTNSLTFHMDWSTASLMGGFWLVLLWLSHISTPHGHFICCVEWHPQDIKRSFNQLTHIHFTSRYLPTFWISSHTWVFSHVDFWFGCFRAQDASRSSFWRSLLQATS